jgi:signal recognition particle subunit SRP54
MVLENLGESLRSAFDKITRSMFVDDKLITEIVREIQRALLQSDVNVRLVFNLTERIKERALKEEALAGMSRKEQLIKIVYDELVNLLGKEEGRIDITKKPTKIMLVGLFGSGKTTNAGKLAKYYQKQGLSVACLQTDFYRPAAYEQLVQLCSGIGVQVFGDKGLKDAVKIYREFEERLKKFDVVIIDTAGRDALSPDLISELNSLAKVTTPDERILVLSADIGQAAEAQAKAFHESCGITGVLITKLDGTAKGGGALIACSVTDSKVKFIGVGEKIDDLERFRPANFVSKLLGMGDLEALLEKAKEAINEDQAEDLSKRFLKGEFNLVDLYEQMEAMNKMGPLSKIVEMIPGFGQLKMPKETLQVQQAMLQKWKIAMDSMTKAELEDPDIMTAARIARIAKGSGIAEPDIRGLLKQYKQSKKLAKMFKTGSPEKLMSKLQKGGIGNMKLK